MSRVIRVRNSMQTGYVYMLNARPGRSFDPKFTPALTPKEMLQLGVFEGKYLNDARSEYPPSWFTRAKLANAPDPSVNCFGVKSRQPLSTWIENGWINEQDPRGWFEWYCRCYQGRRSGDDARQIGRWRAFVRHSAQVKKHGGGDRNVRRVQRQALLQWAHDPFPDVKTKLGETTYKKILRLTKGKA